MGVEELGVEEVDGVGRGSEGRISVEDERTAFMRYISSLGAVVKRRDREVVFIVPFAFEGEVESVMDRTSTSD